MVVPIAHEVLEDEGQHQILLVIADIKVEKWFPVEVGVLCREFWEGCREGPAFLDKTLEVGDHSKEGVELGIDLYLQQLMDGFHIFWIRFDPFCAYNVP